MKKTTTPLSLAVRPALLNALEVLARGNQSVYHVSMDNLHSDKITLAEAQELATELATKYQTVTCVFLGDDHIADAFGDGSYTNSKIHLDAPLEK